MCNLINRHTYMHTYRHIYMMNSEGGLDALRFFFGQQFFPLSGECSEGLDPFRNKNTHDKGAESLVWAGDQYLVCEKRPHTTSSTTDNAKISSHGFVHQVEHFPPDWEMLCTHFAETTTEQRDITPSVVVVALWHLKKNLNASRPSEDPPQSGGEMSNV